ncbi:MAG: hypothetical protein JSR18_14325 [Proteobacteria bacterium]|nr:hypothetical protein [Pseudomonadota bacterium]
MTRPTALSRLTPAQSRGLAVALAVLALLAALALVIGPVLWLHWHYDKAIADASDRLQRYRRVAAQAPAYREALDTLSTLDGRRFFLRNTAANLASAELQELVRNAIEGNGGRINTSQSPAPRDDAGVQQILANVQFFATAPALANILYAIETGLPELEVDNLTVRPQNAFRTFKPTPGQEPELVVQIDVVGWALQAEARPGDAAAAAATKGGKGRPSGAAAAKGRPALAPGKP